MGKHSVVVESKSQPSNWVKPILYGATASVLAISSVYAIQITNSNSTAPSLASMNVAPDLQDTVNCTGFTYQEDAQKLFSQNTDDPNKLDDDNDGIACENLPSRATGIPDDRGTNSETDRDVAPLTSTPGIPPFVPGSPRGPEKDGEAPVTTSTKPTVLSAPPAQLILPQRRSATTSSPAPTRTTNEECTDIRSGIKANVYTACNKILAAIPEIKDVLGLGLRADNPTSCHPLGLALDLMVYTDNALGDRVNAYVTKHKKELGITTILWEVPDHFDHVHISFVPCNH